MFNMMLSIRFIDVEITVYCKKFRPGKIKVSSILFTMLSECQKRHEK